MIDWLLLNAKNAALSLLWPYYEFLFDGTSRYFWLYCLTGVAIAAVVHARFGNGKPFAEVFFDRETWAGRSALNDYFVLFAGSVLRITILSWAFVSWKPIAGFVADGLHWLGVTGTTVDGTALGLAVLMTLVLFLVDDFLRWAIHYVMHRVPELWEYHKVHHSAEKLNFATAERFHPVETIITSLGVALGMGLVNGVFIALWGKNLTPLTVAGANVLLVVANVAGGVLRHAPVWVSFGPKVEQWIISPAMHQIHHSDNPKHFDSNMGSSLAIWDRMFKTLYIARDASEVKGYGIGEETPQFRSLKWLYFHPITESVAVLRRRLEGMRGKRDGQASAPARVVPGE